MVSFADHFILWGSLFATGTLVGFVITWILMQGGKVRY